MNSDKLWILKLIAWFHDPPDKMLEFEKNEGRALKSLEQLIGEDAFRTIFKTDASQLQSRSQRESALKDIEEWKRAKKADRIAAAMDRSAAFPGALQVLDWANSPQLRHPLSGRELDLGALDLTGVAEAIEKVIDEVKTKATDAKSRYLLLWRLMQYLLSERSESSLKANWHLLPADSRIVDHSIWDHLSATSAVVGALPQPSLLVFGIGPVQDFIATARRTQDLWMGSYILSYLSWQGMKVIADKFGPDVMLYPSLRGQPLVDQWLESDEVGLTDITPKDKEQWNQLLSRATLPNKFVALLPNDKAEQAAKDVETAIKAAWEKLADEVSQWLWKDLLHTPTPDAVWQKMWREQTGQIPECYWSIHCWPDTRQKDEATEALNQCSSFLSHPSDSPFDSIFKVFIQTAPDLVNVGTAYSRLHELAQHGFEARKLMRDFDPVVEEGAKCTLCGQRAALRTGKLSARDFWKDVSAKLRARRDLGLYVAIKPDGNERLCSICTTKRFVQRAYFERRDLRGGFPSTSSIAAASFKARVFEKLLDSKLEEDKRKDLIAAMQAHLNALGQLDFHLIGETGKRMLPRLSALRDELPENLQRMATDFIHYDGSAFYEETFTIDRLEKDYGLEDVDEVLVNATRNALRRLMAVCRELKIATPAKYFAILKFDGDRIRDWLRGETVPVFADTLHPVARKMLKDRNWEDAQGRKQWESLADKRTREGHPITADDLHAGWQKFLKGNRFLSPALHASLSRALANFALKLAPFVIEERYCGRIVYAGGDDLLALLPLDQVLPAARELRAFYSGQAEKNPFGGVDVRLTNTDLAGFVEFDGEMLMTMGTTATASVGICLAHHLSPLDKALEAARHAEKCAKNVFGFDVPTERNYRDALSVIFLRRSGEEIRVGARWNYESLPTDTVDLLAGLQRDFAEDRLSMKFAHAVYDEARVLAGSTRQPETTIPSVAQEAALRRLLIRQRGAEISQKQAEDQARIPAPQLARLANELQRHYRDDNQQDYQPPDKSQPGMVHLAQWLQITRFLAQGGDE